MDEFGDDEFDGNEDFNVEEYLPDDDIPDYKLKANNKSNEDKHEDIPFTAGLTFQEFLNDQVGLLQLKERERHLVEYIIGNIDDEGYLRRDAASMVDDIVFQAGVHTN